MTLKCNYMTIFINTIECMLNASSHCKTFESLLDRIGDSHH